MFERPKNQLPTNGSAAVQDDEALSDDVAGFLGSIAVPSMNRDHAMQHLCGDWSSILNSEDSMGPDSDDNTPDKPTDVNEATEASSLRSEVRTSPARILGALRRGPARQWKQRPSKTTSAAECSGVSSRISDYDTTTDDGSESDATLQPQRLRQVVSLPSNSSTAGSNQDNGLSLPVKRVPLPKTPYGRSRRLLIPVSGNLPLAAITMRADVQFIDRREQ